MDKLALILVALLSFANALCVTIARRRLAEQEHSLHAREEALEARERAVMAQARANQRQFEQLEQRKQHVMASYRCDESCLRAWRN